MPLRLIINRHSNLEIIINLILPPLEKSVRRDLEKSLLEFSLKMMTNCPEFIILSLPLNQLILLELWLERSLNCPLCLFRILILKPPKIFLLRLIVKLLSSKVNNIIVRISDCPPKILLVFTKFPKMNKMYSCKENKINC